MMTAAPRWVALRRAAVVLGIVLAASVLTIRLGPSIRYAGFVFFYGAVAASAVYAGVAGGMAATAIGILVVDYGLVAPRGSLAASQAEGVVAVIAFTAVSILVTGLAQSMRRARRTAEARAEDMERQAAELGMQRREAQALSEELEKSNVELGRAMDDTRRARDAALEAADRLRLVDEASRVLTSSLDYEITVAAVARLAVPDFADWCVVHLVVDGVIKQLAVAHVDPEKVRWIGEVEAQFRPAHDAPRGVPSVIRTGLPLLVPVVTDEMLAEAASDEQRLTMMRDVGIHSVMIVPMNARGTTLGALTLISSRPERRFGDADLAIALDLGRRAAVAIDNARLYRAAVAANEAKGNFLATMSHELRTPLTAIIGYQELLSEGISGPVSDGQGQPLSRIKVSATRLLSLIDQILLYARMETGRESVLIEAVTAKSAVDDAIALVSPAATERGLTVRTEEIDPKLELRTDLGKLRQILINLLNNAVKFTSTGEIVVRAAARDRDIVFAIRDTGIGIEASDLEHLFEPFWQVQQTRTRETGGSGLGLSVTRRLVQLLGGRISVESTPAVGTTFTVVLPKDLPQPSARTPDNTPMEGDRRARRKAS